MRRRASGSCGHDRGRSVRIRWTIFGLAASLVAACSGPEERGVAPLARTPTLEQTSAEACGGCHATVLEEWRESLHHLAWLEPNARAATQDFTKTECRACHSPQPVLVGAVDGVPRYRDFLQEDGVTCLSCHGRADGTVAAARTILDAPCRPRFEPRLVEAEFCSNCHQPLHQVFDEYQRSDARAVGLRCVDCHMPQREGTPGRSHGPNGGHRLDFVRRSVAFAVHEDGDEVAVTLRNRTGHRLPGEIPSRALRVRVLLEEGEERTVTFQRPRLDDEDAVDERLDVDEERTLRFPRGGAALVEVRLEWRIHAKAEWQLLERYAPSETPGTPGRPAPSGD